MIDKIIQKTGAKIFAVLSAVVAAMATLLLEEISKYFAKNRSYQKGVEDGKDLYKKQETFWKKKVEEIKEETNMTIKQKMEELRKLKKDFREYVKKNESSNFENITE